MEPDFYGIVLKRYRILSGFPQMHSASGQPSLLSHRAINNLPKHHLDARNLAAHSCGKTSRFEHPERNSARSAEVPVAGDLGSRHSPERRSAGGDWLLAPSQSVSVGGKPSGGSASLPRFRDGEERDDAMKATRELKR